MTNTRGFTLIELMIVVIIVSILTAIAVPNYMQYLIQGRRSEAFNALADVQTRMQACYQQTQAFCTTGTGTTANSLGYASYPFTTNLGFYDISINTINATAPQSYFIKAVVNTTGSQKLDSNCQTIGLDDKGIRHGYASGSSTDTFATCWQ